MPFIGSKFQKPFTMGNKASNPFTMGNKGNTKSDTKSNVSKPIEIYNNQSNTQHGHYEPTGVNKENNKYAKKSYLEKKKH